MFLLSKDYWEVQETSKKGRGIFVKKDILPGTVIGDYIGILVLNKAILEERDGLYDMYFNDTTSILGNPKEVGIHLINHSCSANCDMLPYKGHTLYFSNRYIFQGEELTVQYLLNPPEKNHVCQHACYCGSPICHGTMHTNFAVNDAALVFIKEHSGAEFSEMLPVTLGERLPKLNSYPSNVADNPIYDLFGNLYQEPFVCKATSLPDILILRKQIRETGRVLWYQTINIYIYGIMNGLIIGMNKFPV